MRQNDQIKVHQTEVVQKNLNPSFRQFDISYAKLASANMQTKIKVEVWGFRNSGDHKNMGSV